jgi:tight adherence protein B
MRLLAGLATSITVALIVAQAMGAPMVVLPRRPRRRRSGLLAFLEQEGLSPARFWVSSTLAALATFAVVAALTGSPLVSVVPAALVGALPASYYRSLDRRRAKERRQAWPDALRSLVASLNAGQSPHEALVELSHSGPVPLRPVFARYDTLTQIVSETEALDTLRRELADPLSDRIFEVLAIAVQKGSRIALDILRDVADATTADLQLAEKIDTAQTEQRLNARAVFVLPFLAVVLLCSRPGTFRDYYASADGVPVLVIGTAMSTVGMLIVQRLGRLPAEPRVLLDNPRREEHTP